MQELIEFDPPTSCGDERYRNSKGNRAFGSDASPRYLTNRVHSKDSEVMDAKRSVRAPMVIA
jgi:hypothetical protein